MYVNMFGVSEDLCCPPLRDPLAEGDAVELAGLLKALADPARLRLLSIIGASEGGWACACDLHQPLGRSQPTVSHHLSTLVRAGLLEREQRGKWAWFRVRADRLEELRRALVVG
jgi:ArsR family transcriptional regulator, arsenate/arsenite/antimonite-responsive transcriptional repressor